MHSLRGVSKKFSFITPLRSGMSELVTIEAYDSVGKAQLMQQFLADQGIVSYTADDQVIAMDWLLMGAVGGVKLQVGSADVEAAVALLNKAKQEKADRNQTEVQFDCEECEKPLKFPGGRRGGVETCHHCGCFVDVPD